MSNNLEFLFYFVLICSIFAELMTEVILTSQTNTTNPLIDDESNNTLAVRALLELPSEIITKPMKEQILKGWLPLTEKDEGKTQRLSYASTALDSAVLSLKIKIMRRPIIYDVSELLLPSLDAS